jgi:hypothetical protein
MKLHRFEKIAESEFVFVENRVSVHQLPAYAHRASNEDGIIMEGSRLAEVYGGVLNMPSMLLMQA